MALDMASRFSAGERARPPWFLLGAMVMTWFIGMYGVTSGAETIAFLRQGAVPAAPSDGSTAGGSTDTAAYLHAARQRAVAEARSRTFPLAVAQALLSLLLVVGSVSTLAGRRSARSLVTQALVANALLALLYYALTRNLRGAYIDEVARAGPELFGRKDEHVSPYALLWWSERIKLVVFELGSLGLAFLAVHAKRSRAYFDSTTRAEPTRASDSDEDL